MTTFYDVPANFLIPALAEQLKSNDAISMPEWADVVKTGSSRERPPTQTDWWHTRGAALLRKIARQGTLSALPLFPKNTEAERITVPNRTHLVLDHEGHPSTCSTTGRRRTCIHPSWPYG